VGVALRPKAPAPKPVRKVRTEHGTRVARAVVCSACGKRDTIHFAPKDPAKVLCRRCAADLLGVGDPDTEVGSLHPFTCASCGRSGMTQKRIPVAQEFLCKDCLLGIESKQGTRTREATRLSSRVLRVRRSRKD
jgi:CxxC-x17-CxxC domain-containing protein